MANGLFNEYKNKLLGHLFGNRSFTIPSNIYVGLSTTPINADGTGITEITGGNYERAIIPNTNEYWTVPVNKQVKNIDTITFNTATADWNTYFAEGGVLYAFYSGTPTGLTDKIGFCEITYTFIPTNSTFIIKPNRLTLSQV